MTQFESDNENVNNGEATTDDSASKDILKKQAENGDVHAQRECGMQAFREENYSEAVKWLQLAAQRRDSESQRALGDCYAEGKGVEQDIAKAAKLYQEYLDHGDTSGPELSFKYSTCVLGTDIRGEDIRSGEINEETGYYECFEEFNFIGDVAEDSRWYRKAIEQGDAVAHYHLGIYWYKKRSVEKAMEWFHKSAEQGYAPAMNFIGYCYGTGFVCYAGKKEEGWSKAAAFEKYPPHVLEEEALKWWHKAAELGCAAAQYNIGAHFYTDWDVERNKAEYLKWFRLAAEGGYPLAQAFLGNHYYVYFNEDHEKEALKWNRMAAKYGFADSQYNLAGSIDMENTGEDSLYWVIMAAENGYFFAMKYLVDMCVDYAEKYDESYYDEAIKWVRQAEQAMY